MNYRWLHFLLFSIAVGTCCGCTRLFFFPQEEIENVPTDFGYQYQDVTLRARDNIGLHAWFIKPENKIIGTIYFLHGNAENISTHFRSTLWLVDNGYQVLVLDYRGYGRSEGNPALPQVITDVQAGAHWLQSYRAMKNENGPVFIYGQSLGASLAIKYLDMHPNTSGLFNALIAEAGFARFGLMARHVAASSWITGLFQYPIQWSMTKRYDPLDAIHSLSPLPVMILHSSEDEIVPYSHAKLLYSRALKPKQLITAKGGHIQSTQDPKIQQQLLDFMATFDR